MRRILFLLAIFVCHQTSASQTLNLCVESCKQRQAYTLSDTTWAGVKKIFSSTSKTDEAERLQISRAILLIHSDIKNQLDATLKQEYVDDTDNRQISSKDQARNINEYIALLLDQQLINRHFLRKTEQRSILFITDYANSIQSHSSGEIFTIFLTDTVDENNLIIPLDDWKAAYSLKTLGNKLEDMQQDSKPHSNWDDNFE